MRVLPWLLVVAAVLVVAGLSGRRQQARTINSFSIPPNVNVVSPDYVTAQGWLVGDDFRSYFAVANRMTCSRSARTCEVISFSLALAQPAIDVSLTSEVLRVSEWGPSRVVAVNEQPLCRTETWALDLAIRQARFISQPKATPSADGCAGMERDVRHGHLGTADAALATMRAE